MGVHAYQQPVSAARRGSSYDALRRLGAAHTLSAPAASNSATSKLPCAADEQLLHRAPDYRPAANLMGTIRFLFLSVAALRMQQESIVMPMPTAQPPLLSPPALISRSWTEEERPLNVLCLDGGGIKGRNLMVMIAEIEAACGRPIGEMFDLIAGTSIGGCGALFLSKFKEEATSKAHDAFTSLQSTCLRQQSMLRLVSRGHLCLDERPDFLRDLVGTQTLSSDGPRAFAVASREGKNGLEPFLFRTYECDASGSSVGTADAAADDEAREAGGEAAAASGALPGTSAAKLWEAVVATSAAPIFFPRAHFGGMRFADGGLVANDPTLIAVREAATLWPRRALGLVVSLGTGTPAAPTDGRISADADAADGGSTPRAWQELLPRALKPMTDMLLRGIGCAEDPSAAQRVAAAVAHAAPGAHYIRLQPHLPEKIGPFESDEGKLRAMEEHTRKHFRQSSLAAELCSRLVESRPQSVLREMSREMRLVVPFRGGAERSAPPAAMGEPSAWSTISSEMQSPAAVEAASGGALIGAMPAVGEAASSALQPVALETVASRSDLLVAWYAGARVARQW